MSHELNINTFTAMMSLENDHQKCEIWNLQAFFSFFFSAQACEKSFITMHSIESRCVTGPENILFADMSLHFSAQKLYRLGQWRGQGYTGLSLQCAGHCNLRETHSVCVEIVLSDITFDWMVRNHWSEHVDPTCGRLCIKCWGKNRLHLPKSVLFWWWKTDHHKRVL